jgi:hypothetical protein
MTLSITHYRIEGTKIIIERADWFGPDGNYLKRADLSKATDLHKYTLKFAPDAIRHESVRLISDRLGLVYDPFPSDGEFTDPGDKRMFKNQIY